MKKRISLLIASMITAFAVYPHSAAVSISAEETKTLAEENNARIEETVDRTFEFDKEEMQDKAFLFYGDSLTARFGLAAGDLDYTQILRSEFGFYSYNGAVSGATWTVPVEDDSVKPNTNHLFSQFEKSKILIRDADYISIMLGTNDYGQTFLRPLGTIADHPTCTEEATTVYGAIRYALDYIIGINPDVKIMLMTPTLWPSRGFEKENTIGVTMGDIRTAVKEVGAEYRCKIVDMTDALSDTQDFQADGLHISPYGNAKMASFIKLYGKN